MTIEYRATAGPDDIDANDSGIIFGLAIPFNRKTTIGDIRAGGFHEDVAPGACKKSMAEADIVALFNHDSSKPLGRTSAGNLKLKATTRGVEPQLKPVDTSYGLDLAKLVKAKVIKGWSFGFEVLKDTWTDDEGRASDMYSGTNRTINEMRLIEVSPVTFPAYDSTEISSRDSILAARDSRGKVRAPKPTAEHETQRGGNAPGDGSKPYGDVDYADPGYQKDGKKRYPLDSKAHAKAAWSYINQAANRTGYTAAQLSAMEGKIKAACKKFGIVVDEQNALFLAMEWRKHSERYTEFGERRQIGFIPPPNCPRCGANLVCPECDGASDADDANNADSATSTTNPFHEMGKNKPDGQQNSAQDAPETRDDDAPNGKDGESGGLSDGTAKRIVDTKAMLSQALALFAKAGVDKQSPEVQQAIALVSSASTHVGHMQDHEDLKPSDAISDNDAKGREADKTTEETREDKELKPDDSTSKPLTDDALRWLIAQQIRREVELGN